MIDITELLALVAAVQAGERSAIVPALARLQPTIEWELQRVPANFRDDCRQSIYVGCSRDLGGVIRAIEIYDPAKGPLLAHVRRYVTLAIRDELAKMSCPVSYRTLVHHARKAGEIPCSQAMAIARDTDEIDTESCESVDTDRQDIVRRSYEILKTLPEKDWEIARRFFARDMSIADITKDLCIPRRRVERSVEHATALLRSKLGAR